MDLIERDMIAKNLRLDRVGLGFLGPVFYRMFGLEKANEFYARHRGKEGMEFIDALFDDMNIKVDFGEDAIANIPKEGPFWLVANHPTGIWDGLAMIKLMLTVRPEFKFLTIHLLERLTELKPYTIPVNNWEDKKDIKGNHVAMKAILKTLKTDGNPIGLFPGGSVTRYIRKYGKITDPPWNATSMKLIQKIKIPVVPVWIGGRNSRFFYGLGVMSNTLRRGRNFGEFFNKKNYVYPIEVGAPIMPEDRADFSSPEELGVFLREKVYSLDRKLKEKK